MSLAEDVNTAVRRVVREALGLGENDVRPADQTAPAGQQGTFFGTVKLISAEDVGHAAHVLEHEDPEDTATELTDSVEQLGKFVASVQFFGRQPAPARLRGGDISATALALFQAVTNGGFDIAIDGATRKVTGLDFSAAANMEDVADVLEAELVAELGGVSVTWTGKRFVIDSPSTTQASAIAPATAPTGAGSPTNASTLLGLTAAAGAVGGDNKAGITRWGLDAFEAARRLPMLVQTPATRARMRAMGLGYVSASIARDLSALSPGAAFESRGSIDLTFNVVDRELVTVTPIDSVPIGILVEEPGGVIREANIEIEVSP